MDIKLKKRIIGLMLLVAAGLIVVPLFVNHSATPDELNISSQIPDAPPKPALLKSPVVAEKEPSLAVQSDSGIVFEELQSVGQAANDGSESPVASVPATSETKPAAPAPLAAADSNAPAPAASVPVSSYQSHPTMVAAPDVPSASVQRESKQESNDMPPPDEDEDVASTPVKHAAVVPKATKPVKPAIVAVKPPVTKIKTTPPVAVTKAPKVSSVAPVSTPSVQTWAVQVGSFSDKINAEKLMKTLQAKKLTAYIQTIKTSTGATVSKVLVGPELSRADAEKIQSQLKSINANTMIVKTKT